VTAVVVEPENGFEHEALFYRDDDDFLAGLLPFVREGLEQDEAVVVAEPRARLDLLRDALGDDASAVDTPRCATSPSSSCAAASSATPERRDESTSGWRAGWAEWRHGPRDRRQPRGPRFSGRDNRPLGRSGSRATSAVAAGGLLADGC
jgi:DcmR-like sensory protein